MRNSSKILVTGGTGFIGGYLSPLLPSKDTVLWSRQKFGDIHDACVRTSVLEKLRPSLIIHLAWESTSNPHYDLSPLNVKWAETTAAFAEECMYAGSWFIGAGSAADVGGSPINDTPYGKAKSWLRNRVLEVDPNATWFSPQFVFSLQDSRPRVLREFKDLDAIGAFHLKQPDQYLDYIHVRDVAAGLVSIIEHELHGCVYLGSGWEHSNRALIDAARSAMTGSERVIESHAVAKRESLRQPKELLGMGWRPTFTELFFEGHG